MGSFFLGWLGLAWKEKGRFRWPQGTECGIPHCAKLLSAYPSDAEKGVGRVIGNMGPEQLLDPTDLVQFAFSGEE